MIKPTFILLLFLFVNLNHGRELPEDYWKSIMKEERMPEAIRDLLVEGPEASQPAGAKRIKHFVKDFDTRSIAVIYRKLSEPEKITTEDYKKKGDEYSFVELNKPEMEFHTYHRDHKLKI
ncbi:hypothetical protein JCGZ_11582 [Jatropha curcas]|uniref:Uncharacterized protein n=1 Tax=Jatropha curcas TaxID=180498 RepID=A0A067K4T9_JATCU|nr:uncharacterized protein LOC105640492 [Jatropha curcas]KDP31206.1 hypothetical protein JCGZ_11582 [Jatropha curcas]